MHLSGRHPDGWERRGGWRALGSALGRAWTTGPPAAATGLGGRKGRRRSRGGGVPDGGRHPPRAVCLPGPEPLQRGTAPAAMDRNGARAGFRRPAGRGRLYPVQPSGPVRGQTRFRARQLVQGVRLPDRRRLPNCATQSAGTPVACILRRVLDLRCQCAK